MVKKIKWTILIILLLIVVGALLFYLFFITTKPYEIRYIITGLCLIGSLVMVYTLFIKNNWMNKVQKNLHWYAIVIFTLGFLLYFVGFNNVSSGSYWNWIALVYRAVVASLGMFISQNQLIAVGASYKDCVLYMSLFALIHFAAVLVSFIFILNLFGFRVISWWRSLSCKRMKETYVFFGINENSVILARKIQEKISEKGRIIFVKCGKEAGTEAKAFNFFSLLGHNAFERDEVSLLNSLNALIVYGKKSLSDELVSETYDTYTKEKKKTFDIFAAAGMTILKRFIEQTESISFFFLFDDSKDYLNDRAYTIESMSALRKAKEYRDVSLTNKNVKVYCQSRRNKFNSIFEQIPYKSSDKKDTFEVQIIDDAYLSVLDLKRQEKYHPVHFVDKDTKNATVKEKFTAMIIGFSETGLEAFKFLYEYSAFINPDGREADTKIYVVDRDMDKLKNKFYEKYPALQDNTSVELIKCDTSDKTFIQTLNSVINDLNYIVISIGEDLHAINLASKIAELTAKQEHSRKRVLQICVRSYSNNNKYRLDEIAEYYNKLKITNEKYLMANIFVFGKNEQIYTYDNIVGDEDKNRAEKFNEAYDVEYNILKKNNNDNEYIVNFLSISEGLANNNKQHFNDYQNKSNGWHIGTKLALIGVNGDTDKLKSYQMEYKNFKNKYPNLSTYQLDKSDEEKYMWITNLAKCEHSRWVRAGEILGYKRGTASDEKKYYDKDYINKRMGCMRTCAEMTDYKVIENTIRYDYPVIKVSLDIALEDINTTENKYEH